MTSIHKKIDILIDQSFLFNSKSTSLAHHIAFKIYIEKLLAIPINDPIYISASQPIITLHKEFLPVNPRINYIDCDADPGSIPFNENCHYIYFDNGIKLSMDEGLIIIQSVRTRPGLKYVFVGNSNKMPTYVKMNLFRYMLDTPSATAFSIYIGWNRSQQLHKAVKSQKIRKKQGLAYSLWRNYLFKDFASDKHYIGRYDIRSFPAKPKPKPKPKLQSELKTQLQSQLQSQSQPQSPITVDPKVVVQTKYVYSNIPSGNYLTLPNGTKYMCSSTDHNQDYWTLEV